MMKYLVAMFGMGCIAWMDVEALRAGIDGVLFMTCVSAISGLAVVFFRKPGAAAGKKPAVKPAIPFRSFIMIFSALSLLGCPGSVEVCVEKDGTSVCGKVEIAPPEKEAK